MKDFTTPENIAPIIEEIESIYFIDRPAAGNSFFNNIALILQEAAGHNCFLLSVENADNIPATPALYKLFREIDDFSAAVETYPGELDSWNYREKDRARIAAGIMLIKKYNKPATYQAGQPIIY